MFEQRPMAPTRMSAMQLDNDIKKPYLAIVKDMGQMNTQLFGPLIQKLRNLVISCCGIDYDDRDKDRTENRCSVMATCTG